MSGEWFEPDERLLVHIENEKTQVGLTSGERSLRCQILCEGLSLFGRKRSFQHEVWVAATQRNRGFPAGVEFEVLHGGEPVVVNLPIIEFRGNPLSVLQERIEFFRQAKQLAELHVAFLRAGVFDEQDAAQLSFRTQQFVVSVDLVLDVGFLDNLFCSHHLLHLIAHRLGVLKEKSEVVANMNAVGFLDLEYLLADCVALFFEDFREGEALNFLLSFQFWKYYCFTFTSK